MSQFCGFASTVLEPEVYQPKFIRNESNYPKSNSKINCTGKKSGVKSFSLCSTLVFTTAQLSSHDRQVVYKII